MAFLAARACSGVPYLRGRPLFLLDFSTGADAAAEGAECGYPMSVEATAEDGGSRPLVGEAATGEW